jgi:hypothetical protein
VPRVWLDIHPATTLCACILTSDSEPGNRVDRGTSVGILDVPNSREYWLMSRGVPRTMSGWRSPARKSCTNPMEDMIKDAARGSWAPRSGVGSFLSSTQMS